MFSNLNKKVKRKQKSDAFSNFSYSKLDKKNINIFENIDDLVDNLLARINPNSTVKHEKVRKILRVRQRLSTKKLLSITIFFLLIFAVIASASSFVDLDNNSTDFVTNAVEGSSLDNSTSQNNNTVVNNQSSEHNINDTFPKNDIINASSKNSTSQDNESLVNNETSEHNINDTFPKEDVINASSDKTVIIAGLNLTLNCDQSLYNINETVVIEVTITYNNSPINTSVNILIICPNYNLSKSLNISDGRFYYEFVPIQIGSYKVNALVSYLNESVEEKLAFEVLGEPIKNVSENISNLHIWDTTDYQNKFVGDQVTFYANYSSNNKSIENASILISFNIGGWTQPKIMNYSNGFYVYNNSFNRAGIHTFRVQCSASSFENKTSVSKFVISEVESNVSVVSIVDAKEHEQVYALPGTSFYIERIINGTQGIEAIFAPLYSDGLTIEKIEIINENLDTGEKLLLRKDISPRVFSAGRGTSIVEKKIDNLRKSLPANVKQLNRVSYSKPFNLDGPIIVRVWFRAPSWNDIKSGVSPSSGRISYLTFTDNSFDFESSTWWNANWGNRKLITINSSQVDADLTNFPILINITDTDLRDDAQNDGDDIAFVLYSDNTTKLNHEIELYNGTTGELYAWVNITSLSSSEDTKIWMYYNNNGCSSQQNIYGVWDSNHLIVHHLNETSGTHYDSTSNGNNGTWNDVDGQGSQDATGSIDGANNFDGNDDYISLDNQITFTNGYTLMFWAKRDDTTDGGPLGKEDDNDNYVRFIAGTTTLRVQDSNSENKVWTSTFNPNVWYYIAITKQSNLWEAYRNGASLGTVAGTYNLLINAIGDCYSTTVYNFDGIIDEARISNTVRNASWINTTYNTVTNPSTFISIESEEYNINTSVNTISPYIVTYSPFTITATGANGLDNVTLYYRYSTDNSSWGSNVSWDNESNPDTESPWEWGFNFSNGTGYYEFYSIGNKSGFPNETAPGSADTICYFNESLNTLPEIALINPQPNGTTDVSRFPICQVWANDSDGDTLTVYWYENTTETWVLRNTNNSISPGNIVSYNFTQFGNYSTTFWWKVAINDSIDNISSWFYFTTEPINTSVDAITPYDLSTFSLTINSTGNSNLDNVTLYYRWSEDNNSWGTGIHQISIFEGFESGSMNTSLWDVYSSTAYGQNEVNNTNPHTGSYSWLMAVDTQDNYNLNELYTVYDFTGASDINIEFWHYDSTDEEEDAPTSWSDHTNADAVSFTNDGTTWYEIIDAASLNNDNSWVKFSYNISSHPNFNSDVNSSFAIKFQQYDNWIYSGDGRLWDDVYINFTSGGNGINWTVWNNVNNPDTVSPWSWNFDFPNRTGYYEFYSIGKKSNEIDENPPISADARCYNNPTTIVDPIIPYNRTTSPITITATGNSGFDNVTLYYRWSQDNITWEMGSGKIKWSSELLTNPGFETGDTTGWSNGGGGTMTVGTDCPWGTESPYEGTYYSYWLAAGENLNAYTFQNVSLDTYASYIDAGLAKINVTGWLVSDEYNTPDVYDEFFMNVKFFDTSDVNMSGCWYESGGTNPVSEGSGNNVDNWAQYGITNYTIPVGARKAQVSYFAWEYIDGSSWYDGGSADNFSVKVGIEDYNWTVFGIDSAYPWSWEFNFPNGTGYYEFYSMGNKSGWPNETKPDNADALCKYNRQPIITNEVPSNQSSGISLTPQMNITVNDSDGESMTINWYSNSSGSWQIFGTNSSVANGTYHQTNANYTSTGKTYWWYVTVNDGLDINTSAIFHFATSETAPPQVTSNASTGVEETNATLWGYLYDEGGESCTGRFEYGTTTSYGTNTTNQTVSEGEEFSAEINSLTPGQLYHYRVYVNNTYGSDTGSDISFLTKPQPPTSFNVQSNNSTINFLTWIIGTGANTTYIERNTYSGWALGEGTIIYNGSAALYEDSGLTQGTTYYYQAWSYANWTESSTYFQWSDNNASDSNKTNIRPTITVIYPINASIDLNLQPTCEIWANDTNGDTLTVDWYENTTDSWVLRQTNNSVVANSTLNWSFTQANAYGTTYWWKVSINDTIDNVTFLYHFTTKPINTSVDTIIPYVVDTPPITITATNYTPADNVTLYYRWSRDNSTWGYHPMSIFEGFETGTQNTSLWNTYQTASSNARIQWNYGTARSGSYSCSMDDADTDAGDYALNVIYTNYDFSGVSDINIDFWEREWGDESHNAPNSWTGWGNYDVVAFTNDGNTWYEIVSEGSLNIETFTNFQYNISADPNFVSPPNSSFAIAFQQYDNYQLTGDGRAWDDIYINFTTPVDNSTDWIIWDNPAQNPDETYPWSWNFDFPNSTGFYEFYSIGNLSGSQNETAPSSADARCVYTITPTISNEGPANESINIPVYPQLNITVNDTDAYPMTITWYSNSSGPWLAFGTNTSVYNGTYHQNNSNFSLYFTTFWWYVNVTDGFKTNTSEIFHFRTEHSTFIDIVPDQWDIGSTTVGNYNYSTSNFYFNLSNNGTTTLNIQIKASNATNSSTGAHWELDSTPGFDNYSLQYNKSSGGTWTYINLTYDTFVTNLAIDTWQTFDLNIYMATLSTKSDPLSITVTCRSVIA